MDDQPVRLPLPRPDPLTPPPAYAHLRSTSPVVRGLDAAGRPAWIVTGYELVAAALADPRLGLVPPGIVADERASLFRDGEAHARLRRLVSRAFSVRGVERLRPRIADLAEEHVDRLVAAGPGADLVAVLAAPLAVAVIGEAVGVARGDQDRFRVLADAALAADPFSGDPETAAAAGRVWGDLSAFVADLVARRRTAPGDDLLTDLVAISDARDGHLSDGELVALVAALVAAGSLTARTATTLAVIRLGGDGTLSGPDGPDLDGLVEEVVRTAGIEPFPRWAQTDVELGGVAIAAGDLVLVRLESANHDPDRFPEPERLRADRSGTHLGFGHGPHRCLGAALARLELAVVLRELARRLPGLRPAVRVGDVPWFRGEVDHGPLALPVTW